MFRCRRFRPSCEVLEVVELLSAAPLALVAEVSHPHLVLRGSTYGNYSTAASIPDAGHTDNLSGSGIVSPLGSVTVKGSVHSLGFIIQGHAEGTVKLTDGRGSVTVDLVGPLQRGFASLPTNFTYKIVKGTGAFQGATGTGKATLHEYTLVVPPMKCPPNAMCVPPPEPLTQRFTLTFQR